MQRKSTMWKIAMVCLIVVACDTSWLKQSIPKRHFVEFTASNMSSSLNSWDYDVAVMFYAPWCDYCRQLKPYMESIADTMKSSRHLQIGQFNCDNPKSNSDICTQLKINRYPAVYFVGYGDLNQGIGGRILSQPKKSRNYNPRVARFASDLYPQAVQDWIRTLHTVSYFQRRWDDVKCAVTGRARSSSQVSELKRRAESAEQQVRLYSKELEKYKADEVFDGLEDRGDAFAAVHDVTPSEDNLALRLCIGEMASEYCKYYSDEKYCKTAGKCRAEVLEPQACRPAHCPFENSRGCKVVSTCMQPDIIQEYQKALDDFHS